MSTKHTYYAELKPVDATMHAYYHVNGLKNLLGGSATEMLDRLSEYELVRIFDNILFQILQIGRALDHQENSNDFFDMVFDDKAMPDVPGVLYKQH